MIIRGKHYHWWLMRITGFSTQGLTTSTQPTYEWYCGECGITKD